MTAPDWLAGTLGAISLWQAILWGGAIIGAVVFIWKKKPWRWLVSFAKAILATAEVIDNVKDLPEFIKESRAADAEVKASLAQQDAKIAEIHHETHTNNGTSIKDGVGRLEEGMAGLHGRLDEVERNVAQIAKVDLDPEENGTA